MIAALLVLGSAAAVALGALGLARIHSQGCARDIPGASLTVLEGVGHTPHYADPEAVIAAILDVERRAAEAEVQPNATPDELGARRMSRESSTAA